jgi:Exo-beta-D-glucosaminidase Ig-fold domain/Glycosyl hydrolases family 2/Concanavalin A-like lectin/glucanases superfamily/Glycosyl hydrolases family 2, TIM barrel domain
VRQINHVANIIPLLMVGAASVASADVPQGGPYNARFLEGGIGIEQALPPETALLQENAAMTFAAWVNVPTIQSGFRPLLSVGTISAQSCRCLALVDGIPAFSIGGALLKASKPLSSRRWQYLAATMDGTTARLFVDGREVASKPVVTKKALPVIGIAAVPLDFPTAAHFGGALVLASVTDSTSNGAAIARAAASPPTFDLVQMRDVGVGWPLQKQANIGLTEQQAAWLLPHAKGSVSAPVAKPLPKVDQLVASGDARWQINNWQLIAGPDLGKFDGANLSKPGIDTTDWYQATVPGTVLTTLVDRGVYPDPYYGLNNMAIPEQLARQDYWYRTTFRSPAESFGKRLALEFGGINYSAEIWIDGQRKGTINGAFIRGQFAFENTPGPHVVAVHVLPPPHPGIPHEQSIRGGVGENGGQLAIDGPTFVATEGWDWIPGIRDRNTGLWQPVMLAARGDVRVLDPQIITDLPLPRTDQADIYINVPLANDAATPRRVTLTVAFDDVLITRTIRLPPGQSTVRFAPATEAALRIAKPRLWWPNGYGEPTLHDLRLTATVDDVISDTIATRFGIREVSYELSLFDTKGTLRRVDVHKTDGMLQGDRLIDVRHAAIKRTPGGWAESLTPSGETSSAVRNIPATYALPHLALRVNGVRIAARGGNWGMDDAMKRIGRARLAPFFRLEREANLNVIRNWMGTNTESEFYNLADENGMMVLNDLWQSTQNFQVEPQDAALFLANARDMVKRYRNHPSIVVWFGRNEGVPYPLLNEGLDDVFAELDGTRWYTGSSNEVNLQGSGPYNYRPPAAYFTDLASGFSVETGTPSLATLESIEASIPEPDRWPLSDTFAYHDWHFAGNGDTATFMATLETKFGAPTSLTDFERKAQMMNLETHKAMYEGFLGHLWTKNSGRLLWMSHPSWPSNAWQLYSSDYDTSAAYYGAKSANEPVHVQLNQPGNELVIVNTTQSARPGLTASVCVTTLDNRDVYTTSQRVVAAANSTIMLHAVPLDDLLEHSPMLLVWLRLTDSAGALVSQNFYWRGRNTAAYRALNAMPPAKLQASYSKPKDKQGEAVITATVQNRGAVAALNVKLTLLDAKGVRILPAFYSDNYLALRPGEQRSVTISYPTSASAGPVKLTIRGWNVEFAQARTN